MGPYIKWLLLASLILVSSCQEYTPIQEGKRGLFLIPKNTKIESVKIVEWKVGPMRRQRVTKGIEFKVNLPILENNDLEKVAEKSKADSWLVRVMQKTNTGHRSLGMIKVPITSKGRTNQAPGFVKQIKQVYPRVYYVAAALSSRLERKACPALGHNLLIKDYELVEDKARSKLLHTSGVSGKHITQKVEILKPFPSYFNGGKNLEGIYTVEIALYDSQHKFTRSSFFQVDNYLKVNQEVPKVIKGCKYQDIPVRNLEEEDKMKKFRWNK